MEKKTDKNWSGNSMITGNFYCTMRRKKGAIAETIWKNSFSYKHATGEVSAQAQSKIGMQHVMQNATVIQPLEQDKSTWKKIVSKEGLEDKSFLNTSNETYLIRADFKLRTKEMW